MAHAEEDRAMVEKPGGEWRGSPLDVGSGLGLYGIKEIVIEYNTGEKEVLRSRLCHEYGSYELQ